MFKYSNALCRVCRCLLSFIGVYYITSGRKIEELDDKDTVQHDVLSGMLRPNYYTTLNIASLPMADCRQYEVFLNKDDITTLG